MSLVVREPVVVDKYLVEKHVRGSELLQRAYEVFTKDPEVRMLHRLSNVMAVKRLLYNDHGPVHAAIVAGAALELFERLVRAGYEPTTLRDGTVRSLEEAKLVVLLGALLHDIGNAVHRKNHELVGALMAQSILDRLLPLVSEEYKEPERRVPIRQEVMHAVYATAPDVQALSLEASAVRVGDGLDMAEGRARIPYKMGKLDIHALSALSIKRVEVGEGAERPVAVLVRMTDYAGVFQIEEVLIPKIEGSLVRDAVEVYVEVKGELRRAYP